MPVRHAAPMRGLLSIMLMCALVAPAVAQPRKKTPAPDPKPVAADSTDSGAGPRDKLGDKKKGDKGGDKKTKDFDFNALDLNGRMRTPQLLYFLERANEELERASLEKRSFIPHMVRSVEEERL